MYHTHLNDTIQLSLGLSGPLIVVEPGKPFEPGTDKVFMITRDGPDDEKAPFLVNGFPTPAAMHLCEHVTYRLRILLMTTAEGAVVSLVEKGHPVQWKAFAKDGADLPAAQSVFRQAVQIISPGETYDYEWTPAVGNYRLEGRGGNGDLRFAVDIQVQGLDL